MKLPHDTHIALWAITDSAELFAAASHLLLPISPDHAAAVDALPPIHRDPFDRMLVAQAGTEAMQLLTHDSELAGYGGFVRVV